MPLMLRICRSFWSSERAGVNEYALLLCVVAAGLGAGTYALSNSARTSLQSGAAGAAGDGSGNPGDGGSGSGTPGGGGSGSGDSGGGAGTGGPVDETEPDTSNSRVVFSDSFDSPNSKARWKFNGKWWSIQNGVLQAGPVSGWNELRSYIKGSSFADGTVSLDATLLDGSGYGVFFHASENTANGKPFDGYSFQYDPGYGSGAFLIRKWINGVELSQPLVAEFADPNFQWLGVSRHVEITTKGSVISAKIDGKTVLSCTDDSFRSGGVGLRLWNQADARFDNLLVTTPLAGENASPKGKK